MSKLHNTKCNKRLATRLPIIGSSMLEMYSFDVLLPYLAHPNTALSLHALGVENVLTDEDHVTVSTNKYFVRYLQLLPAAGQRPSKKIADLNLYQDISVGALILRPIQGQRYAIDNIYVHEAFRRQGIATRLLEKAYRDHPDLCLDGRFSSSGMGFFGAKHRTK
jgi:GNAT superfamily N-acetyltransferase